jgi:peptidoglycan/LPS O-acetylase OafA/YrhL
VLAILAFHLDVAGFTGGFLGVDVFFVISGYVILRSILPDLESGRFSLADFFIRRVRRLAPALLVVIAATLAVGFVLLSPAELEELAASALATLANGANIFFQRRADDYFAAEAHSQPLLHMWSLGVEEQFYIIVPAALAALVRLRGASIAGSLAVLTLGSFVYGLIATVALRETHAFYMPMARFWEIAVGGCVAAAERRWGLVRAAGAWVAAGGFLAIGASVLLLDSDQSDPLWALIAVLGSAAVIAASPGSRWASAALASWPMSALGRISYSVYLVHWPAIVFWRLSVARPLQPLEQALIAILTLAAGVALAVLVERPWRSGSGRFGDRAALTGVVLATAVLAAAGLALLLGRRAAWRLQAPARASDAQLRAAMVARPQCQKDPHWLRPRTVCSLRSQSPGTDFVIWGDSHATHIARELTDMLSHAGFRSGVSVEMPGCVPLPGVAFAGRKLRQISGCPAHNDAVLSVIARERPKIVVLAGRWANVASDVRAPGSHFRSRHIVDQASGGAPIGLDDALVRTVARIRATGAHVIVVGPVPEIAYFVPSTLVRSLQGVGQLPPVWRADFNLRQAQVLGALAKVEALDGVSVVYPHKALCDERTCSVSDGVHSLYKDDDHLSPFGAARVVALIQAALDAGGAAHAIAKEPRVQ